jgi:Ca2+-binding RTX toxin-like protein
MSSSVTVVGGVNNSTISGLVSVPVAGLSSTALSGLQSSLSSLSASVAGGSLGLANDDLISGTPTFSIPTLTGAPYVLELTNTASNGSVTGGTYSGAVAVQSIYNTVIAQVPGALTLTGSGSTNTNYILGASTNVDLSTNGATNTILAAGGNDTINMQGSNFVTASGGADVLKTYSGNNTVVATGSASVFAGTPSGFSGKLDFISTSTAAATIFAGSGSATVSAGVGGGTVLGGTGGNNSLTGGSGSVYFVGGGNGDTLAAGFGGAATVTSPNYLFAGTGNETLLASSVTGTNLLQAGSGTDIMSASGSGTQYFFGSTGSATMTGSTMSGANNVYFFGTASNSGGHDVITNFGKNSELIALNGTKIESITSSQLNGAPAALVTLTDGTNISLIGVQAASISGAQNGTVIT